MTTCDCSCHVNPVDYVPTCPIHHLPLYAAEAGSGQCPWVATSRTSRHVGGADIKAKRCITWGPRNWHWTHREMFNGDELPPFNGKQPPRYPSPGWPTWQRHKHPCAACEADTVHVIGDNRSVCSACGSATWVPDPQYVNVGDAL